MNNHPPIYTTNERIKIVIKYILWIVPFILIMQYYFFPFFEDYSKNAHCKNYGSFTGLHVVFYGIFIGLPIVTAIIYFLILGRRSLKVIKLGQDPLPNEKVFYKTKYIYGFKARARAYAILAVIVLLLGLSIQGYFWANDIIKGDIRPELKQKCINT